jgi:hypothetical protein
MAKKQIRNYVFKPGIGANDYVYPEAWSLINQNRDFILSEATAYINKEVNDATKCQRDIDYIIEGVSYDAVLGTSYNAYFLGLAEYNSLDISNTVIRTINRTKDRIQTVLEVISSATYNNQVTASIAEIINIMENGRDAANSVTYTIPGGVSANRQAAHTKLIENIDFMAAEVNAWVDSNYPTHDHDVDKCSRDVKYAVLAAAYDILYQGNSASYDSAKFFNNYAASGSTGITAEHQAQTVAAYRHLQTIISDIVQGISVPPSSGNTTPQVTAGLTSDSATGTTVSNLIDIVADVVESGTGTLPARTTPNIALSAADQQAAHNAVIADKQNIIDAVTWSPSYTYNQSKCERDMGYVVDAYLYDLRYGGNFKLRNTIKYYWEQDVAQVDGTRIPEIDTHNFIGDLITENVLTNTGWTPLGLVTQTIDTSKTAEADAVTKLTSMVNSTVSVITNGLSSMPAAEDTGVGYIKIQGKYSSDRLLLITNTTSNDVIYNFSNPDTGAKVTIKDHGSDDNFTKYLQTTDGVTTLELNFDTSGHNETDDLQIFVEDAEVRTRPFDFGTDAIERMRIAPPLSMLDADFEYGLQPTKWSAIATMRGYPSVYEIPGTDTPVTSVTTDASAGTNGVGQSLITVKTAGAHGFEPGTPITIKALENSVTGAARAEGSFVIITTPTPDTFTYYAKAKVGVTNGEVLSTTYTQLREAGFYTGASIGTPTFTVISNGFNGTSTSVLISPAGSNKITFEDDVPELGAPLTNANIPLGTQVTGVTGTGGTVVTPEIEGSYGPGATSLVVRDSTGIIPNLSIDRGDGQAVHVSTVSGTTINLDGALTGNIVGNYELYSGVQGTLEQGIGSGATFDVTNTAGIYSVSLNTPGADYEVGDRLTIPGVFLEGESPTHDVSILVDTIGAGGSIVTFTATGSGFTGTGTVPGLTPPVNGGQGSNAIIDVTYTNNVYTASVATLDTSQDYTVNDKLIIRGDILGGSTPTHDLTMVVTGVGASGEITSLSQSGAAPDASVSYTNVSWTTSGVGVSAQVDVDRIGVIYAVNIPVGGTGFVVNDTITVAGNIVGGATPGNDVTITIDAVDGVGAITAWSESGVAANTANYPNQAPQTILGEEAEFSVDIAGGIYTVNVVNGGIDYGVNQTFTIFGTDLFGNSPANDLTITIASVDAAGTITSASASGTAVTGNGSFTNISAINKIPVGTGATFDIIRESSGYIAAVNNAGSGYDIGNRIRILGSQLDGVDTTNDLLIRVATIGIGNSIDGITQDAAVGVAGTSVPFISTITMSDVTSGQIGIGESITFTALATLEVTFDNAHGLVPGNTFIIDINSDQNNNNHALASGAFLATVIPSPEKLRYTARAVGFIDTNVDTLSGVVYPRPDSFFIHRPYDGGVQLGTGGPQHGAQAIRQSKKYIRYQSGKGIMYTTGALFAPSYDLKSVTADGVEVGSVITIETDDNDHGVQTGGVIRLLGIETPGYNSGNETASPPNFDYEVVDVIDERKFKVLAKRRLGNTSAKLGFAAQMSVVSWQGATVRSGIFDDQNGIFWEYDGTNISVNQRTGTKQLAGTVSIDTDNNLLVGTGTRFRDQTKAGDRIIIKGMTHVISHVIDDTTLTVTPDYRGVTSARAAKANLVVDKKVKQEDFNLDRLDGTGPSSYKIDVAKMQMIGIQYSWYGAGFIDFMLRGSDGNFVFCHRMRNSNVNTEAFMRSGNLPVRYEVTNEGPPGKLDADMDSTQTSMSLEDTSFFPSTGYVYIDNEIISYSGKDDSLNHLTGLQRSATLNNFQAGASRDYSAGPASTHTANTGVVLISNTITPLISHWGSAFLTDGGFDEDRGYIFSYAETGLEITTTKQTAFMIRLAPSVSNAIIGDLGERELLNRAQLLLQGLEITSDGDDGSGGTIAGGIVVEGILNPQNYPVNPSNVGWTGLSSLAQGGQPSFAQVAAGGSVVWSTGAAATTAEGDALPQTNVDLTKISGGSWWNDNLRVSRAEYDAAGPVAIGSHVSLISNSGGGNFYNGTTVRSVEINSNDVRIRFSTNWFQNINNGSVIRFAVGENLTNRNFVDLTKASVDSAGVAAGTAVTPSGGSVTFPAGTLVNSLAEFEHGSANYYRVTFNNSYSGTFVTGTGTIEFEFVQPPYAQPGETVFSFIATPGERATADFSELKELTNTTLGGRGTFPNGPDVLAINVYKVSGSAVTGNLILRWGEAQA